MTGTADISPCGRYRYHLTRDLGLFGAGCVLFVMLNPSAADAARADPTLRRCLRFGIAFGFRRLAVVNLFALRSTDPAALTTALTTAPATALTTAPASGVDPVGPDNDAWIAAALDNADTVICAWGAHGAARTRERPVLRLIADHGFQPQCLGTTRQGFPRHPLYVRADQPMVAYPGPPAATAA